MSKNNRQRRKQKKVRSKRRVATPRASSTSASEELWLEHLTLSVREEFYADRETSPPPDAPVPTLDGYDAATIAAWGACAALEPLLWPHLRRWRNHCDTVLTFAYGEADEGGEFEEAHLSADAELAGASTVLARWRTSWSSFVQAAWRELPPPPNADARAPTAGEASLWRPTPPQPLAVPPRRSYCELFRVDVYEHAVAEAILRWDVPRVLCSHALVAGDIGDAFELAVAAEAYVGPALGAIEAWRAHWDYMFSRHPLSVTPGAGGSSPARAHRTAP